MDESQVIKGILEGCVLSIINQGETYGYDIIMKLNEYGFGNVIEGTLYPILSRLEKKEHIVCRRERSPLGPIRKYYSITEEGKQELEQFLNVYESVIKTANRILFGGEQL